jgi:hypothetical protein
MSGEAFLRAITAALQRADIPFMITGSVAGAYHGAGRATLDVDLVIDPDRARLEAFVTIIAATGVYVSAEAAREALTDRTMFNVVDTETGWKGDLIIRKDRPFSEAEFSRRQPIHFAGVDMAVATLEDVIVSKLEWAKLGGSARQLEDVRSLLRLRGAELDRTYLTRWVTNLELEAQWAAASAPGTG